MIKYSKLSKANRELDWVIKIVNSARTKEQLEMSLKCYGLWMTKFPTEKQKKTEFSAINYLQEKFWSRFKMKEQNFLTS